MSTRPLVDDGDALHEVRHLLDEVRGDDHRALLLQVIVQQQLVEQLAMIGVQAQYRLVEQQVVHVQRQPDDQLVDGAVARGQRADLLARVQAERLACRAASVRSNPS